MFQTQFLQQSIRKKMTTQ